MEADFGIGRDAVVVEDPETGVNFRGRIDRIDLSADGSSALVVDYKSGSASGYRALEKDIIDAGKRLQLGVYSLAARNLASRRRRTAGCLLVHQHRRRVPVCATRVL